VVIGLVRALRSEGVDAEIAAIVHEDAGHPFILDAASQGLQVRPIVTAHRGFLQQIKRVAAEAARLGAQVIHTHGYHADVIGAAAAWRAGIPVIATLHGFTGEGLRLSAYDFAIQWAHRRAARVVAVSAPIVSKLRQRRVRAERIALIPNAILSNGSPLSRASARSELGVPEAGIRIGWVGRLSAEKAPDVFLSALAKLPDVRAAVSIIGDGSIRPDLEAQAGRLGVQDRVTWHGLVPGASRFLPALDLLVLSSHTEGTPMILLEAMAAGTPIVATAVGGVPDMLGADEALLVPSDDPGALSRAISAAVADPAASVQRAARARERVARDYAVPSWINKHLALYEAAIAGR